MTENNETLGSTKHVGSEYETRLERLLEHDLQAVRAMLTEPSRRVDWLAPGEIELRKGGAAKLNFTDSGTIIDNVVSEFDAPLARVFLEQSRRTSAPGAVGVGSR